ncbi:hypothetical protein D0T85_03095 [Bacteroides sp. 519]|nr:hypothetical protein [Bacteroides sp. 519]
MFLDLPYRAINKKSNALDDLYHININYINNNEIHYYRFAMSVEKKAKRIVEGKLDNIDIGFSNVSERFLDIENSTGDIKIGLKNNIITANFIFSGGEYSGNHKIIWENYKLNHQVFLKVGEQWEIQIRNNENNDECMFDVFPDKGFTLVQKNRVETFAKNRDVIPETDNSLPIYTETAFTFITEKAGKYKLNINNGIELFTTEITVVE